MTIIAVKRCKGYIEIASDSLISYGTQKFGHTRKIIKSRNVLVGVAGDADSLSLLRGFLPQNKLESPSLDSVIDYLSKFHIWARGKVPDRKVDNYFILIFGGKIFRLINFYCEEIASYAAIGSGMEAALGALHLGHGVKKAVAVACKVDLYCGLPMYYHKVKSL